MKVSFHPGFEYAAALLSSPILDNEAFADQLRGSKVKLKGAFCVQSKSPSNHKQPQMRTNDHKLNSNDHVGSPQQKMQRKE